MVQIIELPLANMKLPQACCRYNLPEFKAATHDVKLLRQLHSELRVSEYLDEHACA